MQKRGAWFRSNNTLFYQYFQFVKTDNMIMITSEMCETRECLAYFIMSQFIFMKTISILTINCLIRQQNEYWFN